MQSVIRDRSPNTEEGGGGVISWVSRGGGVWFKGGGGAHTPPPLTKNKIITNILEKNIKYVYSAFEQKHYQHLY